MPARNNTGGRPAREYRLRQSPALSMKVMVEHGKKFRPASVRLTVAMCSHEMAFRDTEAFEPGMTLNRFWTVARVVRELEITRQAASIAFRELYDTGIVI